MYTLITDCFYALLVISLEEARPAARPGEHEIRNLYQFQKGFTFFFSKFKLIKKYIYTYNMYVYIFCFKKEVSFDRQYTLV